MTLREFQIMISDPFVTIPFMFGTVYGIAAICEVAGSIRKWNVKRKRGY